MSRRQKWVLWPSAALVALVALVAICLLVFDWNWLKGPLERAVSAELGRQFRIDGDLEVDLALNPRITVTGLRLANPDWAADGPLLAIARASAVVDLPALLKGEIRLPEVDLEQPALRLETRPDGPPNWQLSDQPSEGPPRVPEIGQLRISAASIDYLDHGTGHSVAARLAEIDGGIDGTTTLNAAGTLGDRPVKLSLAGGALGQLWAGGQPYLLQLDLALGQSDLGGKLAVDLSGAAPAVEATLHSDRVRSDDLGWMAGGAAQAATEQAAQRVAQHAAEAEFDLDRLPDLELDLAYTIGQFDGPDANLQGIDLKAALHDRLPTVALSGKGTYQDQPVVVDLRAGPAQAADQPKTPYRIDATIEAGQSRLTAKGGIAQPEELQGVDLEVDATSPDLSELLRQLGLPAPDLPKLQVLGRLVHDGPAWQISQAQAQIGESELSGQLSVDLSGPRPLISAKLESNRLRMADFVPAPDADAKPAVAPDVPLIENGDINLKVLPPIDADLELHASDVELPEARFDRLDLTLQLRDRVAVIDAKGEGKFRDQPLSIEAHAGTADSLKDPDAPYPLELALSTHESSLQVKGSASRALSLTGLDVDLQLKGPDLAQLGDILQMPLPATPAYDLTGRVTHQADQQRWNLVALQGSVGDSDLEGDVSLELSGERPTVVADLRSKKVDFDDLGVLIGAPADVGAGETASAEQKQPAAAAEASQYVLPDEPFDVPELRAVDARVKFAGDSIQASKLPLEDVSLNFTLEDGTLKFEPLKFALGDGEFEASANLDSKSAVLDGDFDLTLRRVNLNKLLRDFDIKVAGIDMQREGAGTFGGHAKLEASGKSIHQLAASANGELAVIMNGGQINALIVEAIGLDVGEGLGLLVTDQGDTKTMVPVDCFVGQFAVKDGVMDTQALVLKTSDSTITGSGQIDFGQERLALELLAHPQDMSVLTASTPVRVEGTFKKPEIGLASEELGEKGLAALALGFVLPVVGAILPFIELGEKDKGPSCATLVHQAEGAADVPADDVSSDKTAN